MWCSKFDSALPAAISPWSLLFENAGDELLKLER
jgi:hypothetical protein